VVLISLYGKYAQLFFLISIVIVVCGCTGAQVNSPTPTPTPTPTPYDGTNVVPTMKPILPSDKIVGTYQYSENAYDSYGNYYQELNTVIISSNGLASSVDKYTYPSTGSVYTYPNSIGNFILFNGGNNLYGLMQADTNVIYSFPAFKLDGNRLMPYDSVNNTFTNIRAHTKIS
jgi:hypothetical protein